MQQPTTADSLLKLQKIEAVASLGTLDQTRKQKKMLYSSSIFWVVVLAGFSLYFVFQYLFISKKYKYLIEQMKKAKQQGSHFDQASPFFVALALEHPFLYAWKFGNPSFPLALQYAYYSNQLSQIMGTGYDPDTGKDYIQMLYLNSQACGSRFSDAGECSAMTIICRVFANQDRQDCYKPCPGAPGFDHTFNYVSNMAGSASSFAMAGAMTGPIGAAVGAVLGGALGFFKANRAEQIHKKKCNAIRKNCYLPPGESYKC